MGDIEAAKKAFTDDPGVTTMVSEMNKDQTKEVTVVMSKVLLRRELGLVGASSIFVGTTIGSGIFVSPKGVLRATGSVGLCMVVWTLAGIVQLGATLCYAELGSMIPKSGGLYTYLRMGVGNFLSFVYGCQQVAILTPCSLAIVLMTFSKYTLAMLPICGSPVFLEKFMAAAVLVSLAVINVYSTRLSARVTVITTVGKVTALVVIIVSGLYVLCRGTTSELGTGFSGTSNEPVSLALAMYSASYSYGGGESLNLVAEEIKDPKRNLPRAAILGMLLVIGIYVLTNLAYLAVMTRAELLAADAVAVVFADRVLGSAAKLIPVAVMVSTFGAANNSLFSRSRVVFALARDGNFPDVLSYIQVKQLTPLGGMTLTVTLALILLVPGEIGSLMNLIGFLSAFFSVCLYVCLFIFRFKTMKDDDRTIKVPLIIPAIMILFSSYLFLAPLVISPDLRYAYVAAGLWGSCLLLYIPFVHFRLRLPFYDRLVTWIQLIFEVCPPTKTD